MRDLPATNPDRKGFRVHLDANVLDEALMPAVDYRHPGGLTWQEATQILGGLLASDRACGLEALPLTSGCLLPLWEI